MGAMNDAALPHEYFELSSKGVGDGANQTTHHVPVGNSALCQDLSTLPFD